MVRKMGIKSKVNKEAKQLRIYLDSNKSPKWTVTRVVSGIKDMEITEITEKLLNNILTMNNSTLKDFIKYCGLPNTRDDIPKLLVYSVIASGGDVYFSTFTMSLERKILLEWIFATPHWVCPGVSARIGTATQKSIMIKRFYNGPQLSMYLKRHPIERLGQWIDDILSRLING